MDELTKKLETARKRARDLANDSTSDIAELETAMGEVRSINAEIREFAKKNLDETENVSDTKDDGEAKDTKDDSKPADDTKETPTDDGKTKEEPKSGDGDEEPEDDKKTRDAGDDDKPDSGSDDTSNDADTEDPELRSNEKGGQKVATEITKDNTKEKQVRSIEDYIRTGSVTRDATTDGITSAGVGVMVPEQIIYDPSSEIDSVFDLSTLVTATNVTTASGKYPILKRADTKMVTVKELEENPALAKPAFQDVDWSIDTYRGAIPISEESIQDSQVPLMPVIQKNAQEQRVNTLNAGISEILKSFTGVTAVADATLVDTLKTTLNVTLDPAYNKQIVITQSAYNLLDQLKDNEGRYILQQDVTSATGQRLLGKTLVVVNDELLGAKAGDIAVFVGDLARGVLFPKRVDTSIEWQKSEIYGRYLALVMRFGLNKADENAGVYITATAPKAAA